MEVTRLPKKQVLSAISTGRGAISMLVSITLCPGPAIGSSRRAQWENATEEAYSYVVKWRMS